MKILFFITFLCLLNTNSFTLTNEFAPIGATWHYDDIYGIDDDDAFYITGYNKIESISDTIIDGISCRQLKSSYINANGDLENEVLYYTYEIGEKVYFYIDDKFKLLYDFSGNNWYAHDIFYGLGDSTLIIVDSIKYELYDTTTLKTIYMHDEPGSQFYFISNKIIEQIGPTCYLFLYEGVDDTYPPSGLRCYQDNEIEYKVNAGLICVSLSPEITSINTNYDSDFEIHISDGSLFIKGVTESTKIRIINLLGETILLENVYCNTKLDIHNLPKGHYIVSLQTMNSIYSHKIYIL